MTSAAVVWNNADQNSDEWLAARLGVCTASMASVARARSNGLTRQQQAYVDAVRAGHPDPLGAAGYKKAPKSDLVDRALAGDVLPTVWSDAAITYARDLARERLGGGRPQGGSEGFAARVGHEQEPRAAAEYEAVSGCMTRACGFAHTADGRFGASPDRLVIGEPGAIEVKTMVSSNTLWTCFVEQDISEYRDQCLMQMWLLRLEWVDLCLWLPDMHQLRVVRIERDEAELERLEADLLAFDKLVEDIRVRLAKALGMSPDAGAEPYPDGLDEPAAVESITTHEAPQANAMALEPEF